MPLETVTLQAGDVEAALCPQVGGSVAGLWLTAGGRRLELLRTATAAALARGDATDTACFPLVPYSNRIRGGRFTYGGHEVALPLNFGDHPHSIHGHGWQAPWRVQERGDATATLVYEHTADAWPWRYEATQTFAVHPDGLTATLALHNRSAESMPAGLGFHPYFPRMAGSRIAAPVERVWEADAEMMPTALQLPAAGRDPAQGITVDAAPLDNVFTAWGRQARIEQPEVGLELELTAGEGLEFLVVFTPPGESFFCVEPVSHCTDAFNLAAGGRQDTGMRVLAPGERWSVHMTLRARLTR